MLRSNLLVSLGLVFAASRLAAQGPQPAPDPAAPAPPVPAPPLTFVNAPALHLFGMLEAANSADSWNKNYSAASDNGAARLFAADGSLLSVLPHGRGLHPTIFSWDERHLAVVTAHGDCTVYPIGKGNSIALDKKALEKKEVVTAGFIPGCPTWLVVSTRARARLDDSIMFVDIGPPKPDYWQIPLKSSWSRYYQDVYIEFTTTGPSIVITFPMRGSVVLDVDLQKRIVNRRGDL